MSPRVTRSAARLSAGSSSNSAPTQPTSNTSPPSTSTTSRKRKANRDPSPEPTPEEQQSSRKRAKRTKVEGREQPAQVPPAPSTRSRKGKAAAAMSSNGPSNGPSDDTPAQATVAASNRRKSGAGRRKTQETGSSTVPSTSKRSRKSTTKTEEDPPARDDVPDQESKEASGPSHTDNMSEESAEEHPYNDEEDEDDPFGSHYFGRAPGGLSSTLRALSGLTSGMSSRLRGILDNLRQKDDPTVQYVALQELSEILLVSTEDNLSGHFSPDAYVKELVALMQPSDFGEENPEMMLLACRCIANLMEALPASTSSVVYGGAVPILCQKLLEIHYIDLAEQALSTLEKISVEFPASIVREGGLTACLTYLDFFATSTQRTAVTTAANCCRNIPEDSFPTIRDVMPILLNVLGSSDQKVVEQACLCVSRIVESFKYQSDRLEELVSADLLRAILRLLLPGTTNMIGADIHTQFLRVLAITARASPNLSVELFKMNVVDTLYQILTGVSPPSGDSDDIATKIDSVVIMQALIHRPRNQIFETLNVICELLPQLPSRKQFDVEDISGSLIAPSDLDYLSVRPNQSNSRRIELLENCKDELRRFAVILLPTLTDAYSSTVNLNVRQKVLTAQLKMLSTLDTSILEDALRIVPYASFLASILSQQDNPGLVMFALQASELLLERLESIYRYQFHREGVVAEISRLSSRPIKKPIEKGKTLKTVVDIEPIGASSQNASSPGEAVPEQEVDEHHNESSESLDENDDDEDDDDDDSDDSSDISDDHFALNHRVDSDDLVTLAAKSFAKQHGGPPAEESSEKAGTVLDDLKDLAQEIKTCYLGHSQADGARLFSRLAGYFDGDALESITSYELLTSDIVTTLLDVFTKTTDQTGAQAKAAFLEAFMGSGSQVKQKTATSASPTTPYSILVHKLQDLLSRAEHFEVITVHHNSFDSNRSSAASMLAKQLKVRLVADEDSGIPRSYRNIMVSIHAIATFKALDEYLRPRISIAERPRTSRPREGMSGALAAYTAALANRDTAAGRGSVSAPPPPGAFDTTNRTPRRSTKRTGASSTPPQPSSSSVADKSSSSRRTTRKSGHSEAPPPPPPPPAPPRDSEDVLDTLECADEAQLTDESEANDEGADIVEDFEDDMDEDSPDPGAVNMEVASTGRVTARKEDGTRVATPQQSNTPRRPSQNTNERFSTQRLLEAARQFGAPSGRSPLSYAAAIQSIPQDWHIEFSAKGQPISHDTTIYRAVHFNQTDGADVSVRNIWGGTHEIKIKKTSGPPPAEPNSLTPPPEMSKTSSDLPQSLDKNPTTSAILRLLSILHEVNANLDDVLSENKQAIKLNAEPLSQFVNTKLTAKLNRQLEEPLIVASNCLPSWSEDLARLYPFLFPFETRHLFLQSTSFGYSRSMTRWQNAQSTNDSNHRHRDERPFLGRLQRQKVRIARTKILESAIKVMELYGSSPSVLEVEYFEEVGTGLGPTLEFYSTVSKEFSKKKLKLWRENESNDHDEYAFGSRGLFPAPMSEEMSQSDNGKRVLNLFKILGKFVARSMLDSRIIDVSFNPTFFRVGGGASAVKPSLGALQTVDADLARALRMVKKFATAKKAIEEDASIHIEKKAQAIEAVEVDNATIDALGLDFTLPGYPNIELQPDGHNMPVTMENVGLYVDQVLDFTLGSGVQKQAEAFASGFSQVFPFSALRAFTPDELVMLFGRNEEDWTLETLMDSIKADHGYNLDSKTVRNLLQTMSELNDAQRRDFLQFVTGSPKLPIGGFKALTPMFTVVCKPSEPPFTSDDYLPSVMTCVNYLKMPDYSSIDVLHEKLTTATREGQGAFHLS